jgi:DNA integrity scanning protein DisA with diadenylate cyclase activity
MNEHCTNEIAELESENNLIKQKVQELQSELGKHKNLIAAYKIKSEKESAVKMELENVNQQLLQEQKIKLYKQSENLKYQQSLQTDE